MTVQATYPPYMRPGLPGQLADCTVKDTLSGAALENIPFGVAVCATANPDYGYLLPGSRASTATITGGFVPGNVVVVTLNGVALDPIPYAGSQAETVAAIVAQLRAQGVTENVNVVSSGFFTPTETLSVVVNPPAGSAVTAITITGGATQPTVVIAASPFNLFYGISQKSNLAAPYFPNTNGAQPFQGYYEGSCINVLRDGRIYVAVEEAVVKGGPVFIRIVDGAAGEQRGSFRTTAGADGAVAAPLFTYASNAAAGGIAVVQINP